jgi:hypothetical protein
VEPIVLKPPVDPSARNRPIELLPQAPVEPISLEPAVAEVTLEPASHAVELEPDIPPQALCQGASGVCTTPETSGSLSVAQNTLELPSQAIELEPPAPEHVVLGPSRGPLGQLAELITYLGNRVFGALTLIVGLSFLAAYPVLQIFSLGYLLESAGRIGRSGRFRDAFPLVPQASRIGGAVLGAWLLTLPWRFVRDVVADAVLIDPSSPQTIFLQRLLAVLVVVTPLHILFAVLRGGRLRYFLWPFNVIWFVRRVFQGGYFQHAWQQTTALLREVHVLHYFYLGLRGALGAIAWLAIPSTMYAVGKGEAGLLGVLGGILLAVVVMYVPFLQVQFAAENRFKAMFEVRKVRERFRKAPIAFFIAFLFTLVLVIPLYLLKVEVVPRDALWLPSLLFIITIFPLKVLTGWAYGRAGRKEKQAHWILRVPCRLLMFPVALFYAIVVFFTQYTGWEGVRALYEHHAFLLPVPFSSAPFTSG